MLGKVGGVAWRVVRLRISLKRLGKKCVGKSSPVWVTSEIQADLLDCRAVLKVYAKKFLGASGTLKFCTLVALSVSAAQQFDCSAVR